MKQTKLYLSRLTICLSLSFLAIACSSSDSSNTKEEVKDYNEIFVAKSGDDSNDGSEDAPFLTISKAAEVAEPGDVITVKAGVYREAIVPANGGSSEDKRITYQAAEGEDVRILGSEIAKDWTQEDNGTWKIELDSAFFGDFNPFNTLVKHPEYVTVDESGDGWGWLKYGRWAHLGDVFIDNEGLTEREKPEEIEKNELSWFTKTEGKTTTIWANFGDKDPTKSAVEINSRPFAFQPKETGLGYITFKGFTVMNIACHWAPPTVYQTGAVWANGGHHWIIEDNIFLYAKGVAVSIGLPNGEADQEKSGYHIIRNNVMLRCGQAGTTGQGWVSNSEIYGNHIEELNYRKEFGGWETAAIKHHNGNNLIVRNNFIRGVYTADPEIGAAHGIWNDYQNNNWQVSQNIIMNTDAHAILSEAIWEGANLYDNNIIVDASVASYSARGDAWAHNLFVNAEHKWENQPWGERPQLGNYRWVNNVFVSEGLDSEIVADDDKYDSNVYLDGASAHPKDSNAVSGTTPSEFKIKETEKGIMLSITLDEKVFESSYPAVNKESLGLDLEIDANIDQDFLGNDRSKNLAGPITNLKPGENEVLIYEFTPLYQKAKGIIGK